jgi:hypothetical protein
MIYCVWYPSGGFGHFINSILTLHGENFARPHSQKLNFSQDGNAHSMELMAPKYFHEPDSYHFNFDNNVNYSVLIDNGIHNQGERFKTFFPQAKIIKICYLDSSWPIIARTIIHKVLQTTVEEELVPEQGRWTSDQPWAQREKYFLYLRDHWLRPLWRPDIVPRADQIDLLIEDMLNFDILRAKLTSFGISLDDFALLWHEWRDVNNIYIDPVLTAQGIVNNVKNNINTDLGHVTDLWTQAVVYYFLWTEFGKEVPHNDFADFFSNTSQIRQWVNS